MLKTRVAHGYCSRQFAAEACPYANICEQCDNYVTAPEFIPQLQAQLADVTALRDDAAGRGWHTEVARHSRVIASLQAHLHRLKRNQEPDIKGDLSQGRLIERWFGYLTAQRIRRLDSRGPAASDTVPALPRPRSAPAAWRPPARSCAPTWQQPLP